MSPTRFDHIAKEAGLIEKLPGRSRIMHTKLEVEYEGNLPGLIEFLESTFKEPNALVLKVSVTATKGPSPREALVRELLSTWKRSDEPRVEAAFLAHLDTIFAHMKADQKINAIKQVREVTGTGLKEAKDAVEGPLASYLATGGK